MRTAELKTCISVLSFRVSVSPGVTKYSVKTSISPSLCPPQGSTSPHASIFFLNIAIEALPSLVGAAGSPVRAATARVHSTGRFALLLSFASSLPKSKRPYTQSNSRFFVFACLLACLLPQLSSISATCPSLVPRKSGSKARGAGRGCFTRGFSLERRTPILRRG